MIHEYIASDTSVRLDKGLTGLVTNFDTVYMKQLETDAKLELLYVHTSKRCVTTIASATRA